MAPKKKMVTIHKKGKKPLKFEKGGLHKSTHTPMGQKIPASKMEAAEQGKYGPKAQRQARFAENVLKKGRKTATKHRKKK